MLLPSEIKNIAEEMPVAMYVVSESGEFLFANARLRKLLDLPANAPDTTIAQYYAQPDLRKELVDAARAGALVEKRRLRLRAADREIEVQMFCCAARGTDGHVIAFVGVLVESTAEAEFQHVFEAYLPAGVYRLDANDQVSHANVAFAKLHGFDTVDEILGRSVRDFYAHPSDADRVKKLIEERREVHREKITLKRCQGTVFHAYVTAIGFFQGDQYVGRGGFVEDRTSEERYLRIFDDIPVGLYVVEHRDGKDVVVHCNDEFARIHDFEKREEMLGRDLRVFHHSAVESASFLQKVSAAAADGDAVRGSILKIRTSTGRTKTIEINSRPQVFEGEVIGRTGAIRDISDEVEMRDTITELTNDIGAILHTFKHTLTQLKHSISAVTDVLAGRPNMRPNVVSPEELSARIQSPLKELASAVDVLVQASQSATHAEPLPRQEINSLRRHVETMQRAIKDMPPAHWRDTWGKAAVEIEHICTRVRPSTIARSAYRPVVSAAQRISRATALATLGIAREAIEAIDVPLASFRDFVTSGTRPIDAVELCHVEDCVADAINNVTGFADERRVHIRFDNTTHTAVRVAKREVTRALNNLLHNAIKYSWRRDDNKTWISVAVSISPLAKAVVTVENWGVPIPREEIERGLIFRLGFRGRLSSDRGRVGTGVGLADSLRVARAHGGDLRIVSRPASGSEPDNYKSPFITIAYFELPLAREGIAPR